MREPIVFVVDEDPRALAVAAAVADGAIAIRSVREYLGVE